MNEEERKAEEKKIKNEKKKWKSRGDKVRELFDKDDYQGCLDKIDSYGDFERAMRNGNMFGCRVQSLRNLKRYGDSLALHQRHQHYGLNDDCLIYDPTFFKPLLYMDSERYWDAFILLMDMFRHAKLKKEKSTQCQNYIQNLRPLLDQEKLSKYDMEIAMKANQYMEALEAEKNVKNVEGIEPDERVEPDQKVDLPESSNSLIMFTEETSFVLLQLDERSYRGTMEIAGSFLHKTFIIPDATQMEYIYSLTEALKENPYILKSNDVVYSIELSRHFSFVEPVVPLKLFFERKLEDFNKTPEASSNDNDTRRKKWWEYIEECFTVIRGILCGLYAIYSADESTIEDSSNVVNRSPLYLTIGVSDPFHQVPE